MPQKKVIHITKTFFGHREGTRDEDWKPFWVGFVNGYNSDGFFDDILDVLEDEMIENMDYDIEVSIKLVPRKLAGSGPTHGPFGPPEVTVDGKKR
jgi:hypothetical protein